MHKLSTLTTLSGKASLRIVWSDPLPRWEQLSPERQHELIMILVTMLLKQAPIQRLAEKGETDD